MTADILTVMWKEWREILRQGGNTRRGWLGLLIVVGMLGIFMPLQTGRAWVETPILLVYWAWIPLLLVSSMVADSFAGERERHTLETLLASRLSDRAILFGKFGAAVSYGWGIAMLSMIVSLVTVNIAHGRGELLFYPAPILVSAVVLSLLASTLTASIGVLVSLRAPTVQQAAQRMSVGMMILILAPVLIVQLLPAETSASLFRTLERVDFVGIMVVITAVLLVLNGILLSVTMARFQRAKLILD